MGGGVHESLGTVQLREEVVLDVVVRLRRRAARADPRQPRRLARARLGDLRLLTKRRAPFRGAPRALRAHRAPVLTVPTCLLPVARERPLPTTSTTVIVITESVMVAIIVKSITAVVTVMVMSSELHLTPTFVTVSSRKQYNRNGIGINLLPDFPIKIAVVIIFWMQVYFQIHFSLEINVGIITKLV